MNNGQFLSYNIRHSSAKHIFCQKNRVGTNKRQSALMRDNRYFFTKISVPYKCAPLYLITMKNVFFKIFCSPRFIRIQYRPVLEKRHGFRFFPILGNSLITPIQNVYAYASVDCHMASNNFEALRTISTKSFSSYLKSDYLKTTPKPNLRSDSN